MELVLSVSPFFTEHVLKNKQTNKKTLSLKHSSCIEGPSHNLSVVDRSRKDVQQMETRIDPHLFSAGLSNYFDDSFKRRTKTNQSLLKTGKNPCVRGGVRGAKYFKYCQI